MKKKKKKKKDKVKITIINKLAPFTRLKIPIN